MEKTPILVRGHLSGNPLPTTMARIVKRVEKAHDAGIWTADWYQDSYYNPEVEAGRLITGSLDVNATIKIWDYRPKIPPPVWGDPPTIDLPVYLTCFKTLDERSLGVVSCAIAWDGTIFATGTLDSYISIWDLKSGEKKLSIDCGPLGSWAVHFTRDSTRLITGSADGNIHLYNVETGKKEKSYDTKNTKMTFCIATSNDHNRIACGRGNGDVNLFDKNANYVKTLQGSTRAIRAIAFTGEVPDPRYLITGSDDKLVKVYSLYSFRLWATFDGHSAKILGLAVHPYGYKVASCSADKSVRIWDYNERTCLHCFSNAHTDKICAVVWTLEDKLMSVGEDKAINFYDIPIK